MYPNHNYVFYYNPYDQTALFPFNTISIGRFLPRSLMKDNTFPMGPPPGPPGQGSQAGAPTHHPHLSFPLKHNKLEHLQLIRAVLEDVYSDLRICG